MASSLGRNEGEGAGPDQSGPQPPHLGALAAPSQEGRVAGRRRRALKRSGIVLLEVAVGLVATFALGVGLAWWRLSQGPIELPSVARHLETQLSQGREGRPVSIESVVLAWKPDTRSLDLSARNVKALDEYGRLLSTSREVGLELSPQSLLFGRIALSRATFLGGEASIVLAKDGSARIALGPPGSSPDLILPPPPPDETLVQRANRILDGLAATFRPLGAGASLRGLALQDVDLTILSEANGRTWSVDKVSFSLKRDARALNLDASGVLQSRRGSAPVSAAVATDTAFQRAVVELRLKRGRIDALAPGMLGALKGLEAPVTAAISATLDRKLGVESLEGEAEVGRGRLVLADGAAPLDGGRVRGRYDIESDVFVLEEAALAGSRTRITGEGRLERASALLAAHEQGPAAFNLEFARLVLDMPGVFEGPVTLSEVGLRGAFDAAKRQISIDRFRYLVGEGSAEWRGRVWWEPDEQGKLRPGVDLDAGLAGTFSPRDVLALWPLKLAPNSRAWAAASVQQARISGIAFRMRAPPAQLANWPLPDQDLDLKFTFDQANVHYLKALPPILNASGQGRLGGNSFTVRLDQAVTEGVRISNGLVNYPRFRPEGALASYSATAAGEAKGMLALVRKAVPELDKALFVDPETVVGAGTAKFAIHRPMIKDAPASSIGFDVDAALENVGARGRENGLTVSDWRLRIVGDQRQLTLSGPLRVEGSPVSLAWTETLRDGGPAPSRFSLEGELDAGSIERLGVPITPYVRGPVGVRMSASGKGPDIASAAVETNLTRAEVQAIDGYWFKPKGQAALVRFDMRGEPDGGRLLQHIEARGPGLRIDGEARFLKTGELAEATMPRVEVDKRIEGRIDARRTETGALSIEVGGRSVAVGPFLEKATLAMAPFPKPAAAPQPVTGVIRAERLLFRGGAELARGAVDFGTDGREITWLSMRGQSPKGPASLKITPRNGAPAAITFSAPDAGLAWEGVTGQNNVRGGVITGEGVWTPYAPVQARVSLQMRSFELVQVPAMARLFSSFGSLRGMVDMLNGDGIAFNQATATIALSKERLRIEQTRMNGPSVGLTTDGSVDLADGKLSLDGVIVPSYGLNSFLGGVPVLGSLLTSRRGEGVVGMTFSMRGPAEDARVFVNPLSALAPGILRRIFEPLPPQPPAEAAATPPPKEG